MREYLSPNEASAVIASEVAQYGVSKSWTGNLDVASEVEKNLAKFNIGYVDPKSGTWSYKRNGTRFFSSLNLLNGAKGKLFSLMSVIKK